jgi:hypothetical protein
MMLAGAQKSLKVISYHNKNWLGEILIKLFFIFSARTLCDFSIKIIFVGLLFHFRFSFGTFHPSNFF